MSEIRYLKITLVDGTRFTLRVTRESARLIHGFEVNAEGDEVVPPGYENRHRTVERALIAKAVELRMSKKYATLVPRGEEGHAKIRKSSTQLDAEITLNASEAAKRLSDDVYDATEHRAAAEAHRRAAKLHKALVEGRGRGADLAGANAAWLHDLAAINHRQAATARSSRALKAADPSRTQKTFAAFKEKLSAANEHTSMAQEYARQALAAARKRG